MTYEEHHRVGLIGVPGLSPPGPSAAGLDHFAYTFASRGALLANHRRLHRLGIEPFWCINHEPTISIYYYRDPDGNKIETQYNDCETADEATKFIERCYGENFMGIIFDPFELARRYESGEAIEELVKRPTLPTGKTPWDMHIP